MATFGWGGWPTGDHITLVNPVFGREENQPQDPKVFVSNQEGLKPHQSQTELCSIILDN